MPIGVPASKIKLAAISDAPLLIPIMPGSARGLFKSTCKQADALAMQAPTSKAVKSVGNLNCHRMWSSSELNSNEGGKTKRLQSNNKPSEYLIRSLALLCKLLDHFQK